MSSAPDATAPLVPPSLIGAARLACGAAAGAITKTIIAPLERIKIIHQTQGMHLHNSSVAASAHGAAKAGVSSASPNPLASAARAATAAAHGHAAAAAAHGHHAAAAAAAAAVPGQHYTGIFQTLRHILEKEGWRSLWNGNGANVVRVIPNYGLRFSFNDRARELVASFKKSNATGSVAGTAGSSAAVSVAANAVPHLSKFDLFLAGSLAGIGQITITYPAEVVFTRLTISGSAVAGAKYSGIFDCIRKTVQHEGLRAFYNGYSATLLSGVPYVALQMSCYEIFQRSLAAFVRNNTKNNNNSAASASAANKEGEREGKTAGVASKHANANATANSNSGSGSDRSVVVKLTAGAFAGLVAQTLTFPGDVIRKRMQSDGMGGKPKVYKGLWDACVKITQREGFKGFFDGVKVNSWRCLPEGALMFVIFDGLKQGLKIDQHDQH